MRKKLPSDLELQQYIYDYGFDKAIKLLGISAEEANKILNPKPQYSQYQYNTVIDKPLHKNADKIVEIIAKHYPELKKKYPYKKDKLYMSQTSEDFLQKAVISCMEKGLDEVTEDAVLELFRIQFNTISHYAKKSSYIMKKKLPPLEVQNDEGEYIITTELNAIPKEAEEGED